VARTEGPYCIVQRASRVTGAAGKEGGVRGGCEASGCSVAHWPQGADDMGVAGQLKGGGDVYRLVHQFSPGEGGGARGQVGLKLTDIVDIWGL
jgi:hypothetical protein